jgi:prepilin-type N-terminal cleavage/methylation domain-containing protein/prepilin-type processing-associated H-X9-DG protein
MLYARLHDSFFVFFGRCRKSQGAMDSPRGFTLIEILVVVAILAILAALALPVIGNMNRKAGTAETISNLRQIFVLFGQYGTDNNGEWPAPRETDAGPFWSKDKLFPYINNGEPATNWSDLADTVFVSPNAPKVGSKDNADAPTVANPANQGFGMNVYLPSADGKPYADDTANKDNPERRVVRPIIGDNLSKQMLLMDCNANVIFGEPHFLGQFTTFVKNRHDGKNTVLFCDGHVELIDQARFDTSHPDPLFPWHAPPGSNASIFWRGE